MTSHAFQFRIIAFALCTLHASILMAKTDENFATESLDPQILRSEIKDLELEKSQISNAGPTVMLIFGYVFAPVILVSPMLLALDCDNCNDAGLVTLALGGAGVVVGAIGLVKAINNNDRHNAIDKAIESRQRELDRLSWDIRPTRGGAAGTVAFRF